MHGRQFCMRWIIREWPGPSADGLGPRMAPNRAIHRNNRYAFPSEEKFKKMDIMRYTIDDRRFCRRR